jgi:hypothetical protein
LKILEAFKTLALFMIAAGLFAMSYVIYDVMGKHDRYIPVNYEDEEVIVMDTHTGEMRSVNIDAKEPGNRTTYIPVTLKNKTLPKKEIFHSGHPTNIQHH